MSRFARGSQGVQPAPVGGSGSSPERDVAVVRHPISELAKFKAEMRRAAKMKFSSLDALS